MYIEGEVEGFVAVMVGLELDGARLQECLERAVAVDVHLLSASALSLRPSASSLRAQHQSLFP